MSVPAYDRIGAGTGSYDESSVWHELSPADLQAGMGRLRADLENGTWEKRYGRLREERELDVGLRLICAELR